MPGSNDHLHNNYQISSCSFDACGKSGLQHDLASRRYLLNPSSCRSQRCRASSSTMASSAVVKAYVGLPTIEHAPGSPIFKFGSVGRPGHRGICRRRCVRASTRSTRAATSRVVPTSILTPTVTRFSQAHSLDANLEPIEGKSREGSCSRIDSNCSHVPHQAP